MLSLALGDDDDDDDDSDEYDEDGEEDEGIDEEAEERRQAMEAHARMFNVQSAMTYKKPPQVKEGPPDELIGRVGFRRILLGGELLRKGGMDQATLDALYDDIDRDGSGGITFYDFWTWFVRELEVYNRNNPKKMWLAQQNGPFTMYSIVSLQDRALLRFSERKPSNS